MAGRRSSWDRSTDRAVRRHAPGELPRPGHCLPSTSPDGTIAQTIASDDDEKDARARCGAASRRRTGLSRGDPEDAGAHLRYGLADHELPASSARPDQHLLIKASTSPEYLFGSPPDAGPDYIDTYVSVLQVGDAVTFLDLRGWEASETDLEDVHRLAGLATGELLDWRARA